MHQRRYRPDNDDPRQPVVSQRHQTATVADLAKALCGGRCPEFRVLRLGLGDNAPKLYELNNQLERQGSGPLTISQLDMMKAKVAETMGSLGNGAKVIAYLDGLIYSIRLQAPTRAAA